MLRPSPWGSGASGAFGGGFPLPFLTHLPMPEILPGLLRLRAESIAPLLASGVVTLAEVRASVPSLVERVLTLCGRA